MSDTPLSQRFFARGNALLGTEVPLLCGAMTWVSTPELVAAVCNAGAFGALAGGNMPPNLLAEAIEKMRQLTDRKFAVNLITLSPAFQEQLAVIEENHVPVVIFAGGMPHGSDIARAKATGAQVLCFAPTESVARRLVQQGVDGLILEGCEAGGHIGPVTLTVLLQQVLFSCGSEVPVFVAGGIATGRMMAHLLMLGAAGVQMGTRFAVAKECTASAAFKEALLQAPARAAQPTSQFDQILNVVAVRALQNAGSREFDRMQLELITRIQSGAITHDEAQMQVENFWVGGLRRAVVDGDVEHGSVMAGQSVGLVNKEETVAEIIQDMCQECEAELRRTRELLM